ncbi:MAG: hypothetical protein EOS55_00615 [Mesorhizobium sp.]|uniref:hypothetical protein n=1 Tax=Mesorhizobium sp. TaxID=1871066 RepID=UPI000FE61D06|nr:hypothetical protein [Mesorhizobium sp.]RWC24943.1 MAG: hypothetical protein EOS27_29370 [Mesorhizobium sp.]RWC50469.1 MAG: hypothetical protein EOS55_00615 [Mesorhizobium sp.]TIX21658.1 MAG: hypothetical protein E5V35_28775 [Mesorhizobium sp.]
MNQRVGICGLKSKDTLQQPGGFFDMLFLPGLDALRIKTIGRLSMCRSRATEVQNRVSGKCDKPLLVHQTFPPRL